MIIYWKHNYYRRFMDKKEQHREAPPSPPHQGKHDKDDKDDTDNESLNDCPDTDSPLSEHFTAFNEVVKSPNSPSSSPLRRINVGNILLATLGMGIACAAPSIPTDIMNMVYGGAAACAMEATSSIFPSHHFISQRDERYIAYDSSDDDSDIGDIDDDSNPVLRERKRVEYSEDQIVGMTKWERGVIENQIGMMKHTKRYISYENQTSVAVNINNLFNTLSVVIQMVIGYTQSGKTGCMVELIDQMTKNTSNPISIENIFIITGLSSSDWMKQTKGRIPECMRDRVFHNGQLAKFKAAVAGKQNVLIIIDEAHMASKKKQTMSRIFKELNWKLDHLMENDIKLVQFSATPDGLIFALNGPKWPEEYYRITTMTPGSGYFGAKQMNERKQLKQIKDIYGRDKDGTWINVEVREQCIANIVNILRDQLSFGEPRYLIVRVRGGIPEDSYHKNFFEAIQSLSVEEQEMFERCNIHSHHRYDMRGNVEDISELLYTSPTRHSIVFIKEKMKCAQTLEYVVLDKKTGNTTTHKVKHNIGVVVERKRNGDRDEQNDSFTIQGLLGRLCGYEEHDCICYTNLKSFEKYEILFDRNFDTQTLKRVSWNSNTTHGKGDGRGTSVCSTLNEEVVDSTDGRDDIVDIKSYRIYEDESTTIAVCKILGYRYIPTRDNDTGFKETSLNGVKGVASLSSAVKKVPTAYGTNNGVKTYRVYYPCYADISNSATLRYVVIIRPGTDEGKIAECDLRFASLAI